MKNINELRSTVFETIDKLVKGKIDKKIATQVFSGVSCIMSTVRVELQYRRDRKEEPNISFMNVK